MHYTHKKHEKVERLLYGDNNLATMSNFPERSYDVKWVLLEAAGIEFQKGMQTGGWEKREVIDEPFPASSNTKELCNTPGKSTPKFPK